MLYGRKLEGSDKTRCGVAEESPPAGRWEECRCWIIRLGASCFFLLKAEINESSVIESSVRWRRAHTVTSSLKDSPLTVKTLRPAGGSAAEDSSFPRYALNTSKNEATRQDRKKTVVESLADPVMKALAVVLSLRRRTVEEGSSASTG